MISLDTAAWKQKYLAGFFGLFHLNRIEVGEIQAAGQCRCELVGISTGARVQSARRQFPGSCCRS